MNVTQQGGDKYLSECATYNILIIMRRDSPVLIKRSTFFVLHIADPFCNTILRVG